MKNTILKYPILSGYADMYHDMFEVAEPFQHVVIDDIFCTEKLKELINEFDETDWSKQDIRNDEGIQVKLRSNWKTNDDIPPVASEFIQYLNSGDFLRLLSRITGINGLICDPYLTGGGFNQINRGGLLAVHADGNWHDLMGVHRRLNVIVYLNENWESDWGGNFELWNRDITKCVKSIEPLFNRMVIFKTDDFSFHGHPNSLNCPPDRSRRSLILYYYTNTRPEEELAKDEKHRAQFYKLNGERV